MTNSLRLISCVAILGSTGCGLVLGLDDYEDAPAGGTGGEVGQGGAGAAQGGGGSGTGNTGGTACEPGKEEPCYSGPAGVAGKGICVEGTRTCAADGSAFGECVGEVLPEAADDCATVEDENCDGQPNDGCPCVEGVPQECYTGPVGTAGIGICKLGSQDCVGGMLGACAGDVVPTDETCSTADDDDCDGEINEEGDGCACTPNATEDCYGGPAGTKGVGACQGGTRQCNAEGTAWGPCDGEVVPSAEVCPSDPDEDCDGSSCGEVTWAKGAGDALAQTALDVAADNAGNVYVTGNYKTSIDFGNGITLTATSSDLEVYVAKYNAAGVCQWAKRFGGDLTQAAGGIAVTPAGDVVVSGNFSGNVDFAGAPLTALGISDLYVVRLGTDGSFVWAKRFGTSGAVVKGHAVTFASGDVAVAGEYSGAPNLGGNTFPNVPALTQGIFVVQLAGNTGNHVWSRSQAPTSQTFSSANDIKADAAGFVYITGRFDGTLNLGCGSQTTTAFDGFVAKIDSAGNCSWSKLITGTDTASGVALDVTSTSVWMLGSFNGSANVSGKNVNAVGATDVFMARLNPATGVAGFAKVIGGTDVDSAGGIAAAPDDQVHVGGYFKGTIGIGGANHVAVGSSDVFLARFNVTGDLVWSHAYGDAAAQTLNGVARTGSFDLVAAGENSGAMTMGAFTPTSAGVADVWVAKLGH